MQYFLWFFWNNTLDYKYSDYDYMCVLCALNIRNLYFSLSAFTTVVYFYAAILQALHILPICLVWDLNLVGGVA